MPIAGIVQRLEKGNNCNAFKSKPDSKGNSIILFTFLCNDMRYYLFLLLILPGLSCTRKQPPPLRIAAAANMQYAMKALGEAFAQKTGIRCEYLFASSGKLTAQITQGAPFDLFLSADLKYPRALYHAGLTIDSVRTYAYGRLILWTYRQDIQPSLELLFEDHIRHIALANPKTAPYGKAAIEVLQQIDPTGRLSPKLIYGESIAQTNHFILSGNAELGFTAKSVLYAPELEGQKGRWLEIPPSSYAPIAQGVVVLKSSSSAQCEMALRFRDFLFSAEARQILHRFGYLPK